MKCLITHVLALCIFAVSAAPVRAENVAIVLSSDTAAYQEELEGFREVVRYRIVSVQTLKENPGGWREELKRLRVAGEPDLIFVVGISALQAVANDIHNIPVVHALVLNPGGEHYFHQKEYNRYCHEPVGEPEILARKRPTAKPL